MQGFCPVIASDTISAPTADAMEVIFHVPWEYLTGCLISHLSLQPLLEFVLLPG